MFNVGDNPELTAEREALERYTRAEIFAFKELVKTSQGKPSLQSAELSSVLQSTFGLSEEDASRAIEGANHAWQSAQPDPELKKIVEGMVEV